jgi:hypothetical protein
MKTSGNHESICLSLGATLGDVGDFNQDLINLVVSSVQLPAYADKYEKIETICDGAGKMLQAMTCASGAERKGMAGESGSGIGSGRGGVDKLMLKVEGAGR